MTLAIQQSSWLADNSPTQPADLNQGWTMPQPRSAAWPRTADARSPLLSLLSAPRPDPKYTYRERPKTSTFLYSFLYSIASYYILFPCSTEFRYILLHSIAVLPDLSRHSLRPLAVNVYQCFAPNIIAQLSVYIRACRRADILGRHSPVEIARSKAPMERRRERPDKLKTPYAPIDLTGQRRGDRFEDGNAKTAIR